MLVEAFKTTIFPYVIQLGLILGIFSLSSASYGLYRKPNWQEFIDKLKSTLIAYCIIKGSFAIFAFIDKIIAGIKI